MHAHLPIRWTDPATWPWIVWLWAALLLAGWTVSSWRWLQRRRAAGWPATDGRIESVVVTKPTFSFTTKRGYYLAELRYSYSIAGAAFGGRYKREFPTEHEAAEFVRDLQGKPAVVHYNPTNPSGSSLLEPDVEVLLQNRAPALSSDTDSAADSIPDWIRRLRWIFVWISAIGLVVSLLVHLAVVMGHTVSSFFWILHVGIFVVWFPAVLVAQKLGRNAKGTDAWKGALRGAPQWMRYMVYGFLAYAMVNFFFFMTKAPGGSSGADAPASVWRGFSGHWMAFYSAALAILYSAARVVDASPRCPNGHFASQKAIYCTQCGQPVLRGR